MLLQSEAPTHPEADEAPTEAPAEASEQTEGDAPSQPTEQEKAESIQALVTAFDALMQGDVHFKKGKRKNHSLAEPTIPHSLGANLCWTNMLYRKNMEAQPYLSNTG